MTTRDMRDLRLFGLVPKKNRRVARYIARALSVLPAAFYFVVTAMIATGGVVSGPEGAITGAISAWITASLLIAWRWERIGGLSSIASAVALGVVINVEAGGNTDGVELALCGPVIFAGGAFLLASR